MSLLGSSPITSILGYVVIVATVVQQVFNGGFPHDAAGWTQAILQIITGIALRMSKDQNVSNAPVPSDAKPV